jgi:hypothetical protein
MGDILVRLLENLSKQRVCLIIDRTPENAFRSSDISYLQLIAVRVSRAFKTPGTIKFWENFGVALFLSFKSRDPQFLLSWLHLRLSKMSAFSHKKFLGFMLFLLRLVCAEVANDFGIVGCRIDVVGKISVSGNARSRSIIFKQGYTGFSNVATKTVSGFYLVRTHTGCLGLTLWLFYR